MFDTAVVAEWSELAQQARREVAAPGQAVSDRFMPEPSQALDRLHGAIAIHIGDLDVAERAKTNWLMTKRPIEIVVAEELTKKLQNIRS